MTGPTGPVRDDPPAPRVLTVSPATAALLGRLSAPSLAVAVELLLLPEPARGDEWFLDEYLSSLRAMTLDDTRKLMRFGVPLRSMTRCLPVPCLIRVSRDGAFYEPDEGGASAYVMPVDASDGVLDLLAWHPLSSRWALRLGAADLLGRLDPEDARPQLVHRSPLGWLAAECRGVVVLAEDGWRLLREAGLPLQGEDAAHAREIRARLA